MTKLSETVLEKRVNFDCDWHIAVEVCNRTGLVFDRFTESGGHRLQFELAAETGFDGIEIMCDDRWTTRDPAYLQSLVTRFALSVLAVHSAIGGRVPG